MLTIDGSAGEGGGQVLRTALSLAAILSQPIQIINIRAGRKQPGLRPQHVLAVRAAAALCNARLEGAREHSRELAEYENGVRAGFTGYGRQGYPAERVADDAVDAFLAFHASGALVDPHLADQLILPLALCAQPLAFRTSQITQHLLTNIWVVEQFLGPRFTVSGRLDEPGEVQLRLA